MTTKPKNQMNHKTNYLTIGLVLGTCFMVAMQNPIFILLGLALGIALNWRQCQMK
jgi:hypothetical protein